MIAKNLQDAYRNLEPDIPLDPENQETWSFYTDRENNPINELKFSLLESQTHGKILYTGHRGSGKSTELNRLSSEVKNKFLIVKYSLEKVLDINNLNYIDLLISIAVQIFVTANDAKVKLKKDIVTELRDWKNTIVEKTKIHIEGADLETQAGLSIWFARFQGKLKTEHKTRKEVRTYTEPQISELIERVNNIIDNVRIGLKEKDLLVIIDDLDHSPLKVSEEIFYRNGAILTQPKCKIIYTIPIAIHYSKKFVGIKDNIGESFILPNIRIFDKKDDSKVEENFKLLQKFITKRMEKKLIEDKAIETAIRNSGGLMRELIRILRSACRKASLVERERIDDVDTIKAVVDLQNEYSRFLKEEDYSLLGKVRKNKEIGGDEEYLELLNCKAIVEYQNEGRWCDIHPCIRPLLETKDKTG